MTAVALAGLRHRRGELAASFLALLLGATIIMAFASLLDTAGGPGVDDTSKETLTTMASVVGGWGLLIVGFAVASTMTLAVRRRAGELALLRSIGATPAQVRRLVVAETGALALVAGVLAVPLAAGAGAVLVALLRGTGQIGDGVGARFGAAALGVGLGVAGASALGAAFVAGRRAAGLSAAEAVRDAERGGGAMTRKRKLAAAVALLISVDLAVVTSTVFHGKGIEAMSTAAQASIFAAIGLALLAPVLVRAVGGRLAARLADAGPEGHLAAEGFRGRLGQAAGALVPIVLFTGIATATLGMQAIENGAAPAAGVTTSAADARAVETLNLVVVGMIAVFAAIMLVNALVAATAHRRREFAQERLAGATPGQVQGMVALEGAVLLAVGVLFGTIAALPTVLSFSFARTDGLELAMPFAIWLAVVAVAVALVLTAGWAATRRAISAPAVRAVAA